MSYTTKLTGLTCILVCEFDEGDRTFLMNNLNGSTLIEPIVNIKKEEDHILILLNNERAYIIKGGITRYRVSKRDLYCYNQSNL